MIFNHIRCCFRQSRKHMKQALKDALRDGIRTALSRTTRKQTRNNEVTGLNVEDKFIIVCYFFTTFL